MPVFDRPHFLEQAVTVRKMFCEQILKSRKEREREARVMSIGLEPGDQLTLSGDDKIAVGNVAVRHCQMLAKNVHL